MPTGRSPASVGRLLGRTSLDELRIDYRYVAAWSLWADIKILLRTVVYAVGARGQ